MHFYINFHLFLATNFNILWVFSFNLRSLLLLHIRSLSKNIFRNLHLQVLIYKFEFLFLQLFLFAFSHATCFWRLNLSRFSLFGRNNLSSLSLHLKIVWVNVNLITKRVKRIGSTCIIIIIIIVVSRIFISYTSVTLNKQKTLFIYLCVYFVSCWVKLELI